MAKILIVDDRVTNRELLLTLLGYAGHELLEASDGEEGLAISRAEQPELIITDIMMPKMDGYEFARQVRGDSLIKDTQIIFYTSSYIVAETMRLANACGVSIVIGKPIEPENFLKKINEALATRQVLVAAPVSEEFHREHMRMLTDTLVTKVEQLEAEILEREQVEMVLQASELRFRSLIEHGLDNISMLTAGGALMWESPSATRMLGYQFNEYIGRSVFDLIHPDDVKRITHEFQELLKEPNTVRYQSFRLHHANGNWLWVECIGTNLLNEPSVKAIVLNYRDITQRKEANDALTSNEKNFRTLVEHSSDWFAKINIEGIVTYVSDPMTRLLGYSVEEFIGMKIFDLIHPNDIPNTQHLFEKLLQDPSQIVSAQYQLKHKDNSWRWVESIGKNLLNDPDIRAIIGNFRDITERKQTDEHIRYQANLLQNVSDAIIASDMNGYITTWNPAAEAMYGWTTQEAIGNSISDLLKTEYENTTQDQILKQFMEQGLWHGETRQRRKDGSKIVVFASVSLVRDTTGAPAEMVAVNRDITEQKIAEELLRESEEQNRTLIEHLPTVVYTNALGNATSTLYVSPQIQILLGYTPEEWLADPILWSKRLHPEDRALVLKQASDSEQTKEPFEMDYRMIARDDRLVWVHDKLVLVHDLQGEPKFWQGIMLDITERKQAEQKIHRQIQRLNALRAIDFAISNSFDMKLSLKVLLNGAISQLGVSAAAILLFNRTMSSLEYAAGEGFDASIIQTTNLRIGEGLAGRAALERQAIYKKNLTGIDSELVNNPLWKAEKFVSYYGVPLIAKGELKGILELFHRTELDPDQEWLDFLETLAGQAAIAIDNAQLFDGMQRSNLELSLAYDATIEGWSAALDLRDKETEGHSQRVTELTVKLAGRMGIPESELLQIRRGALLHDIGKLGVPDNILLKPAKLTNEEWEIMQKHPVYAYDMLSSISYLKYALDIPYCHHEKWDGTGYPRGLKSESIPLAARIFAIVDVWDALTSDRPYRPAWTRERTLEHIKEQSGSHFDPQVVDAFFKMMNKE